MNGRSANGNGKIVGRAALGLIAAAMLAWGGWVSAGNLEDEKHRAREQNLQHQLEDIKQQLSVLQRELTEVRLILARQRLDGTFRAP